MFEIVEQNSLTARIKVIGIGGGGGNAVNTMIGAKLGGVDFMVANTDAQSLEASHAPVRIQLGGMVTKGLGAGANPEIGRRAALEDQEMIREYLDGSDMIFITAGMGGGTGTGGAPVLGASGPGSGRAHGRRRHQAVHLRGQEAHAPGRGRHRRTEGERRYADRHSQPASLEHRRQDYDDARSVSQSR